MHSNVTILQIQEVFIVSCCAIIGCQGVYKVSLFRRPGIIITFRSVPLLCLNECKIQSNCIHKLTFGHFGLYWGQSDVAMLLPIKSRDDVIIILFNRENGCVLSGFSILKRVIERPVPLL